MLFYILAVTGRTSFGVAGEFALDRFNTTASGIAVFTAVQVGVYALAQIPTGLAIDRFGPKRILIVGALLMSVGQITLGFTQAYAVAIAARVLIGIGDATAFLSVLRIIPGWFPLKWSPLFTQLTASFGQLGQFISAVPFLGLLQLQGWTVAFISLGSVGVLVAIIGGLIVKDPPGSNSDPSDVPAQSQGEGLKRTLKTVFSSTVTWEAFFIHWSAMVMQVVFTLLWGMPLMTMGMGLSVAQASMILTLNTVIVILAGPLAGPLSARLGVNRSYGVLVMAGMIGLSWTIFFASQTPRGLAAIIIVHFTAVSFTPASNFGFDSVREQLNPRMVATGTGLGNMGGFISAMFAAQLVGVVLDLVSDGETYTWQDFRIAWIPALLVWAIGYLGIVFIRSREWRKPTRGHVTIVHEG